MKRFFWFKFPLGFFETPECRSLMKTEKGKRVFLFYIFLLCHSVGHEGYLSLENGKPMPLSTLSLLFCKPIFTIFRYCRILKKKGLFKKTKRGYFVPNAISLVGNSEKENDDPQIERRKEEEEKEIEIDKYLEKEKEKEREKAKAKESRKTPRYGNFDPEAVFAARLKEFDKDLKTMGGESP